MTDSVDYYHLAKNSAQALGASPVLLAEEALTRNLFQEHLAWLEGSAVQALRNRNLPCYVISVREGSRRGLVASGSYFAAYGARAALGFALQLVDQSLASVTRSGYLPADEFVIQDEQGGEIQVRRMLSAAESQEVVLKQTLGIFDELRAYQTADALERLFALPGFSRLTSEGQPLVGVALDEHNYTVLRRLAPLSFVPLRGALSLQVFFAFLGARVSLRTSEQALADMLGFESWSLLLQAWERLEVTCPYAVELACLVQPDDSAAMAGVALSPRDTCFAPSLASALSQLARHLEHQLPTRLSWHTLQFSPSRQPGGYPSLSLVQTSQAVAASPSSDGFWVAQGAPVFMRMRPLECMEPSFSYLELADSVLAEDSVRRSLALARACGQGVTLEQRAHQKQRRLRGAGTV